MKIGSDNLSTQQTGTVSQLNDLLSLLKRLDSLPARVLSNTQGQLLLSTRFGNIQSEGRFPLQPGQQVNIRLDASTGQPTVAPARVDTGVIRLPVSGNGEMAKLLSADNPVLARVMSQSAASMQIRVQGTQLAMPQIQGLKPDQLLSARLSPGGEQIELQPLDRKPLLKALLSQLVSRSPTAATNPAPLVELFRSLGQFSTPTAPQANSAQTASTAVKTVPGSASVIENPVQPVAAGRNSPVSSGAGSGGQQAAGNPAAGSASPGGLSTELSLLQLLPRLSAPQARILGQWIAPFVGQQAVATGYPGQQPLPDPLRVLQQVSNGDFSSTQLRQLLGSLLSNQSTTTIAQQSQSAGQENRLLQEMQLLQSREVARLVEQIGNQTQTQRTSVSLQQEIQQPMVFALSLPVIEGKQIKQLDIKVEQRNRAKDQSKQGWDTRLSFEFGAMGMVSCHIFLLDDEVSSNFYCELDKTRQQFESALPSFRQQLIRAGFSPKEINSYPAAAQTAAKADPWHIGESILDIKV